MRNRRSQWSFVIRGALLSVCLCLSACLCRVSGPAPASDVIIAVVVLVVVASDGADGRPAKDVFVLKNGCVCCVGNSASDELERTIDHLLMLASRSAIDAVVVECSGASRPALRQWQWQWQ